MPLGLSLPAYGQQQTGMARYAVLGFTAKVASDFVNEFYYANGGGRFSDTIEHSRAGNATMTGDYGPELVTNGSFDTDSDWTKGTGWTIGSGVATSAGSNAFQSISQDVGMTAGNVYSITFDVQSFTSGSLLVRAGGGTNIANIGASGSYSLTAVAEGASISFLSNAVGYEFSGSIDNISVREVPKIQWAPHNLLTYSEDFSASNWTKSSTTVTSNAAMAPDGTITADKISHTTTAADLRQDTLVPTGIDLVFAVFLKYIDHQWIRVSPDVQDTWVDIQNGVIGTDGSSGATLTALADDWYMVEVPRTTGDTVHSARVALAASDGSNTETSGTEAYIWGAHLYRSDLGGMADVPADDRVIPTATKYVRTAGRVIGSELVTNGTFDSDTSGWTALTSAELSVNSEALRITNVGANFGKAEQQVTTVSGGVYLVTFDHIGGTSSTANFRVGTTSAGIDVINNVSVTGTGSYSFTFNASTSSVFVGFVNDGVDGSYNDFDNISVKEIDVDPAQARYLPRRGHHVYNGSQWVNKGLLHESEARTNLITYSDDFTNAAWAYTGTSDEVKDANGYTPIVESATSLGHYLLHDVSVTSGVTYTFSFDVKARENTLVQIASSTGFGSDYINFDLQAGSIGYGGLSGTIAEIGSGEYRVSASATATSTTSGRFVIALIPDNTSGRLPNYTGTSGDGVLLRHVQHEAGSTPSSYIPTNGSSVTRPAETLTIPAANLPWPSPVYVTNEELVTNGTFDADTDWTKGTGWTIGSGVASCDGTQTATSDLSQNFPTTVGSVYEVTFDVTVTAGYITYVKAGAQSDGGDYTASGTYTTILTAASTTGGVVFGAHSTFVGSIDNISVKEINPLALSIQMSGEMTYADGSNYTEAVFWRQRADSSNELKVYLDTFSTNTGNVLAQQKSNGTDDYAGTSGTLYSPDINVPFDIGSRHGSTFVQSAADGTSYAENTTPVALPDLSATDLQLAYDFMGTIDTFRMWEGDIADAGLAEATEPSEEATLFLSFDGSNNSYIDFEWSE